MARRTTTVPAKPPRTRNALALGALALSSALLAGLSATGCKGFIEDQKEFWSDWYHKPDPWTEVKNTANSPDRRARYVALLQEPAQHGGTAVQQEEVFGMLAVMAKSDPAPICRMQAIAKLSEFKDQRRVRALQEAYDNAKTSNLEVNSQIRQIALKGLGESRDPEAQKLLLDVGRAYAAGENVFDHQLTLEERLTAVRGLANYRGRVVNEALMQIVRNPREDIALRDRAFQSLRSVTGRTELPNDTKAWEQVMNTTPDAAAPLEKSFNPLQLIGFGQQN